MTRSLLTLRAASTGNSKPSLSYAGSPFTWTYNSAIAAANPTNAGGPAASYAVVSGALPTGVSLNATTGALTGTPTQETYAGAATIRATGSGGSSDVAITFVVNRAPAISYAASPVTTVEDTAMANADPTSTAGQITSYAVQSGSLPAGVTLNTSTGRISGTPTTPGSGSATIRATGPGGTGDATFAWTITAAVQLSRPTSDVSIASWRDQAAGSTNIFQAIDETVADDADYVRCTNPATPQLGRFGMGTLTDPVSSSGHKVRWRECVALRVNDAITLSVVLRQGTTLIATCRSGVITSAVFGLVEYTLSGAEADAISDYSALRVDLVATGWVDDTGANVQVSFVELEVPAAP